MPRSVRSRVRHKISAVMDIDITSLLDIITILLVFLIMSYNPSGVDFNIHKDVVIPRSKTKEMVHNSIVVQVSPTTIWVDNKTVLDSRDVNKNTYSDSGYKIVPLYDELMTKKSLAEQVLKLTPNKKEQFSGMVNLIIDKSIKYSYIKKILYTCAEAGYVKYKLLVQGNE